MSLFSRKTTLQSSGVFRGFTDWHSHILPGVDDGVGTMDESLEILRRYEQLGVRAVWLTPHIMEDVPNTTSHLRQRFAELQSAYKGSISLHLAAENMLDSLFEERLKDDDLLPIGESRDHLLVETSYYNPPMNFHDLMDRISEKGFTPVFAHPERYTYMAQADYRRLKETRIKFQLNLFSLVGYYGMEVKKKAEWLLKNAMYNLIGTDIHAVEYLDEPIRQKISRKTRNALTAVVHEAV